MNLTRRGLIGAALAALVPHRHRRPTVPFPMPPTSTLVVPTGATSGARIVIDGNTGTITGYDANNNITFELQPDGLLLVTVPGTAASGITFDTADPDQLRVGSITTQLNAGGTPSANATVSIVPPRFLTTGSQNDIGVSIQGTSHDGLVSSAINLAGPTGLPIVRYSPSEGGLFVDDGGKVVINGLPALVGEAALAQVTVNAGNASGTAVVTFANTYTSAPKVLATINSGSGSAIRATCFVSAGSTTSATIRVDTNVALGATVTFPVAVLVVP